MKRSVLSALCAALGLALPAAVGQEPARAVVWEDPELLAILGPPPGGLARVLAAAGYAVQMASAAELAAELPGAGTVVLPYGPYYPAPMAAALAAFLARGGVLVTLGLGAPREPLYPTPSGWRPASAARGRGTALAPEWSLAEGGGADRLEQDPDAPAGTWTFMAEGLKAYAYRGTALPKPIPADAILVFEARGEPGTERLCLELRERDGSRWKAVVGLAPCWTLQRIHLGGFVCYDGERLGRAGTPIRPAEVERLLVGMTAGMAGPGRVRFSLRGLGVEPAAVETAVLYATRVFAGAEQEALRWFGKSVAPPPRLPALGGAGARRFQADRLVPAVGALASRRPLRGAFNGLAVEGPERADPGGDLPARLSAQDAVERLPLLRAEGGFTAAGEQAAALFLFRHGRLAGGRWLALGVEVAEVEAIAGLAEFLGEALRLARRAVLSDGVHPQFRVEQGRVVMDALWHARPGSSPEVPLAVRVALGGRERGSGSALARLGAAPGQAAEAVLLRGIALEDREWLDLELTLAPGEGAPPLLGPLRFRFDGRAALTAAADAMRDAAAGTDRLHGYSFIDSRGMRALLGAHELFGGKGYRETALAWGRRMLGEQRPDGGYRMGYGITARGEECYVADGGETAVAIARLISYAQGEERAALLRSLDAYMAFREGFRVLAGGIGVGWCLHDYGRRPVVPLQSLAAVLAPELNPYTVGCSLAAAFLHAALRRSPDLEARAAADAEWLMARTKTLHGATMEGFLYAHALAAAGLRRTAYEKSIEGGFAAPMRAAAAARKQWWLEGGGRHALDLGGLAYRLARLGEDPVLAAETMRAACLMFSQDPPGSVVRALQLEPPGHDGWLLICNGTLGLVDVLRPIASMQGIPAREQAGGVPRPQRSNAP